MDELSILQRHRPDPAPPTAAERAAAERALTLLIERSVSDATDELALRRPRRRRGLAPAMAAAAVVRHDHALVSDGVGSPQIQVSTHWALGDGNYATDLTDCLRDHVMVGCPPPPPVEAIGWLPVDGTPDDVRDAVEGQVEQHMADQGVGRSAATAWVLALTLEFPMSEEARSSLLGLLAELPEITSTAGATTAFGAVGTSFVVDSSWGRVEVVVDPTDGFLLEARFDPEGSVPTDATGFDRWTVSYQRPETVVDLPPVIATARDHLVAVASQVEADHVAPVGSPADGPWCEDGSFGMFPGAEDIPELATVVMHHCWQPT